jgi:hypothetical protein
VRTVGGVATGLAAAGLVAGPTAMRLAGPRGADGTPDTAEVDEVCIKDATDVSRRANGASADVTLPRGAHVQSLSERNGWSRVSYSAGGAGRVGWVPTDSLVPCPDNNASTPAPSSSPEVDDTAPAGGDGDWSTFNGCPAPGDAKQTLALSINPLKNRFVSPTTRDIDGNVTLDKILAPGDDTTRWDAQRGATIEGWIVYVKKGGVETCNCHSKDPQFMDTHIGLALTPDENRENHEMIIEVTPRFRAIMAEHGVDWSTDTLASDQSPGIVGKHVRITGWLLFDGEHSNMAENTAPGHPGNWRASAWEIHPVTAIEVLSQ